MLTKLTTALFLSVLAKYKYQHIFYKTLNSIVGTVVQSGYSVGLASLLPHSKEVQGLNLMAN